MKIRFLHFLLLNFLIFLTQFAACQNVPNKKQIKTYSHFFNDAEFENATIAFLAKDVESKKVVFEYQSKLSLIPASAQKIISTATALEVLKPDFRFETWLEYEGTISTDGTLNGNIFITGFGDPCLASKRFVTNYFAPSFFEQWLNALQKLGIKRIIGAVCADISHFEADNISSKWIWEDIANYYGSAPSALSVYDNTYYLTLKSGKNSGDSTQITDLSPQIEGLNFENHVKASDDNSDNAYIFGSPDSYNRIVRGTIPKARNSFIIKGAIPNPALLLAQNFSKMLEEKSISVSEKPKVIYTKSGSRTILYKTFSPKLHEIVFETNRHSVNLYAELLLIKTAMALNNSKSIHTACETQTEFWQKKGIDTKGMNIYDGSGLAHHNTVTATQLVDILIEMNRSSAFDFFYHSLPVAGENGTLSSWFIGNKFQKNICAKTGSMKGIKSMCGYIKKSDGKIVAFALIINNYTCKNATIKSKIETFLTQFLE